MARDRPCVPTGPGMVPCPTHCVGLVVALPTRPTQQTVLFYAHQVPGSTTYFTCSAVMARVSRQGPHRSGMLPCPDTGCSFSALVTQYVHVLQHVHNNTGAPFACRAQPDGQPLGSINGAEMPLEASAEWRCPHADGATGGSLKLGCCAHAQRLAAAALAQLGGQGCIGPAREQRL